MPGEHAVCHAGNALRPSAVLVRLFNIPLSRPRPSPNPHRSAAAYSTPARYPGNRRRQARINDTSSLAVALEAHRRVNRDYIIHKTAAGAVADSSVWFRPELPLDRFDPIVGPESEPASSHSVRVGAKVRGVPPADYVGEYVEPLYDRQDVLEEDLPWSAASRLANGTALERSGLLAP
ncbi:PAP/25A-associated [Neofusicoccum parvum]|nr:PAP/25A-associated [Neofusicoccum parvum]